MMMSDVLVSAVYGLWWAAVAGCGWLIAGRWRTRSWGVPRTVWLSWTSPSGNVKSVAVGAITWSTRRGWAITIEHGARWLSTDPHDRYPITTVDGAVTAYGWTQRAAVRRVTARCRDDSLWRRG